MNAFPQGENGDMQPALSRDSLIKNDKKFSYAISLDSLLRERNALADSLNKVEKPARSAENSFLVKLLSSRIVRIFFWGLLAVLVSFILYRLFDFNISGRRGRKRRINPVEEADLKAPDWYEAKIKEAETSNDYRLAFRYRFKRLLALLSDNGLIGYLPEKTNQSYLSELKDEDLKDMFRKVAGIYEYVWYGKIGLSLRQYDLVKELFSGFKEVKA